MFRNSVGVGRLQQAGRDLKVFRVFRDSVVARLTKEGYVSFGACVIASVY